MKKLTVVGSVNADHVIAVPYFPKAGETLRGSAYSIAYGGKGANQAVAARRLGACVDFIGCVGDDDIGQAMKQAFAQEGINVANLRCIAGQKSGMALIQVASSGENNIVVVAGANACVDEQWVNQCTLPIRQADYLLMQLEIELAAVVQAATLAKQGQTQVILNPAPAQPLPEVLWGLVDIITPNESEIEILTGVAVKDPKTAQQACDILHQKGVATVLITLGAKGVYLSEQGQGGQWLKGFEVKSKDSTGAGDTFNGALASALCDGKPLSEAVHFAQAAAAISVTQMGAQASMPRYSAVLDFLAEQRNRAVALGD